MKSDRNTLRLFLASLIAVAAGLSSATSATVFAQTNAPEARHGAPHDWSHKHLIYTNPETRDEAARKGTLAFEKWKEKNKDPRFALQAARKARSAHTSEHSPFSSEQLQWANRHRRDPPPAEPDIHRDWSNVLGGATGVGKANVFPAKFNFEIDATPNCTDDFVVYTTASSGTTGSGALATRNGTFTGTPSNGQTVTITNGTRTLTLTASTTVGSNTGLTFQVSGAGANTATLRATNLKNAINRNGGTVGVTATSAAGVVTVTAITHGTGGNSIGISEGLTGFAWASGATTLAGGSGTAGQPTIVAFNQLYKTTCGTASTPVPATFWSYNTGDAAFTETSPVLSLDGAQVAFVQRNGTTASLVLLKWSSTLSVGTVGAPTTPTSVTPSNYRSCNAPCMTVMAFSGSPNNTNSSPYYVYFDDILYVGADDGTLHKFTDVFNGTPAEVIVTGQWPASVSAGNMLTSPVYDANGSRLIFVGSDTGASTGGQLHSVDPATGTVESSGQLASYTIVNGGANTTGVRDAPIVDWAAQRVYVFVESDTSQACNTAECKAIYQFPTSSSIAGLTGPKVQIGRGQIATRALYAGAFDNMYYSSADGANPSGNLYVCGTSSGTIYSTEPTLWKIPIANNVMQTPVAGPMLIGTRPADCSSITEVMNVATDRIYVSVSAAGTGTCTGACIYVVEVPTAPIRFDRTSSSSTINSAVARYINISASVALNTTETSVDTQLTAAQAGTYYRMTITQSAPSPAGDTFTYFLRSNAVNTTITCAIPAGAVTCSDTTHTATLATGALVDVRVVRTAGTGNLTATFRVQLEALGGAVPAATAGLQAPGGAGGVIIDNVSPTAGASQIYYSTLTSPGNAVQASQAGLQ